MKSLLKGSVGAVALLAAGGIAFAQDAPTPGMPQTAAADITCAQIADLDEMEFERAVFFLAGVHHAQRDDLAALDPMDPMEPDDDVAAVDPADPMEPDDDVAAIDPADPMEPDDDVAAVDPVDPIEPDDDVAAADPVDPIEPDDDVALAPTEPDPAIDPAVTAAIDLPGIPDISIEQARTACQDSPDMRVVDVLGQEFDLAR